MKPGDELILKYPERDQILITNITHAINSGMVKINDVCRLLETNISFEPNQFIKVQLSRGHQWIVSPECFIKKSKRQRNLPAWF